MGYTKKEIERGRELLEKGQRRLVRFVRGPISRLRGTVAFGGAGVRTVGGAIPGLSKFIPELPHDLSKI